MTRWVVDSSLRLTAVLVTAAAVFAVIAVAGLRHASVDTLPEFLPPQVQVQTSALGLSADEVEQLITVPLEDEFNGLAFLDRLQSRSVPGLSSIELTFKAGTDLYRDRQLVSERVAQGPAVANVGTPPVIIQPESAENRVMMVGLSSNTVPLVDLSTLARWRVTPRLLAVPGVAGVAIWGQRDRQLQVLVDPARMVRRGITLDQVVNTTGDAMWASPLTYVEASSPGTDGFIDTPNQRLSIQHILPINTSADLAAVPVEDTGDAKVSLGDVSTVVEAYPPLRGDAVLRDGPGFLLVVQKLPGANTLAVTRGIDTALSELAPGLGSVTVDASTFRPASFVESALGDLGRAALAAILLVTLWLGVAARSWRVALIGFTVIVLSLLSAAYVLYLRGATFTMMTAAGFAIALGVIIDDVVVTVTGLRRGLSGRRRPERHPDKRSLIADVASETSRPQGYALAIILLGAAPLFSLSEPGRALTRPIVSAFLFAALASAALALVLTPVLAHLLLPTGAPGQVGGPDQEAGRFERWVDRVVTRGTTAFARRPRRAYALVAALAAAGLAILPQLGTGTLIPGLRDRNLVVQWQAPAGTSLPEMDRTMSSAGDALRAVPGVSDVASHIGQALMGDQVVDVNCAETWISIATQADYGSTLSKVLEVAGRYPGLRHSLLTYPAAALQAAAPADGQALTVRLYGTDQGTLAAQAGQLRRSLASIRGVTNPRVQMTAEQPTVLIDTDVTAAALHGLKPGDVRRATAVFLGGIPVGSYYQQQEIFDVIVWSEATGRRNLTDVQNLPLDTPGGQPVPLRDVATVSIRPQPVEIDHDQASRYVDVTADVHGVDLTTALSAVEARVQSRTYPLGYHAEVFSGLQQRQAADTRTLLYAGAALIGIFLLMQAALRSWGAAALALSTWPLAATGGVLTAFAAGRHLTAGTLGGLVVVLCVAIRGNLRLLRGFRGRERDPGAPGDPTRAALVIEETRRAAFPVTVTAGCIALAVLPFVLLGTVPGTEILRPLGLVVLGGLATSTLVTLFVLPALYLRFTVRADRERDPASETGEL